MMRGAQMTPQWNATTTFAEQQRARVEQRLGAEVVHVVVRDRHRIEAAIGEDLRHCRRLAAVRRRFRRGAAQRILPLAVGEAQIRRGKRRPYHKGRAIFYSLSNFCMTKPFPSPRWSEPPWMHGALRNYTDQDPEYPLLPYGRDAKRTLLAKAVLAKDGVRSVSFLPMMIDRLYRPEVLRAGDPRFDDMVAYMAWASEGFDHAFTRVGDEVLVTASNAHSPGQATPGGAEAS